MKSVKVRQLLVGSPATLTLLSWPVLPAPPCPARAAFPPYPFASLRLNALSRTLDVHLGAPAGVRPNDGTAMAAMHRVTTDANGRLTIDGRATAKIDRAALSGHLGAALSAPAKGTPPCDDWGCTCQGLSDKFGTVVGGWHHAKQVPTAAQFWEAHKCHTFPSGTGKPRPPEPAAAGSMLLKAGGESDPEARNRFKERELFFQAQRERLEAEAAKERQVLATMMKNRVQAASDGPTGDGALAPQRARTEERDDLQLPHGLRAHAPQARVVIATAETRFCLNVANFDRSSRNYATMLKVRNYAAVRAACNVTLASVSRISRAFINLAPLYVCPTHTHTHPSDRFPGIGLACVFTFVGC